MDDCPRIALAEPPRSRNWERASPEGVSGGSLRKRENPPPHGHTRPRVSQARVLRELLV
jgi:hypothetical protein